MSFVEMVFGRSLPSYEEEEQRVGPAYGIPMLGLDALSSAAYGPEAALTILLAVGGAGLDWIGPLTGLIIVLLAILYFSYCQTIGAYPSGGGSYTVARENLGIHAGLLAASSLLLDYILNVAVGIAAGVGALISAVPMLKPHILAICLVVLVLITLVNLRGVRASGAAFVIPTYAFIATLGLVLLIGIGKAAIAGGHPAPVEAPPGVPAALGGATVWLLLRAFANGCTAMTGVEAISNGITAFRASAVDNARRTLTWVIAVLALLLGGIAYLCQAYGIAAADPDGDAYQSVLSMLTAAVAGRGVFYYVTLASVISVVCLSANTSFADFPRLCRLLALDKHLPEAFAVRGRRLVSSYGIVVLSLIAGALLIAFGGITDRLIPLFAIGAFGAFTLSQAGMVVHWRRAIAAGIVPPRAKLSMAVNAVGAVSTFAVLLVVLVTKFTEGAWIVVLLGGGCMALLIGVKRHYDHVSAQVALSAPIRLAEIEAPVAVLIMRQWSTITENALRFALSMTSDVIVVHIDSGDEGDEMLRRQWASCIEAPISAAQRAMPCLIRIESPFRRLFLPLLETVKRIGDDHPTRTVALIIPELIGSHWYDYFLHNQRTTALKAALLLRRSDRLVVVNVPWYLRRG